MRGLAAAGAPPAHGDSLTLRIGIDGRAFVSPAAGVQRYVANLVSAIAGVDSGVEIVALGGPAAAIPSGVRHVGEPWHPPTNLGWTLVGLPIAAARAQVDVLHAPSYTAPFWSPVPVVLTIHDVSYARHPEWYPYRRDWVRRAFYRGSAHAAAHIVTVSAFSAGEIAIAYGIPPERVSVTPLGVSPDGFAPLDDDGSIPELPTEVRVPYVLHVGDLHERRNLGVVVEALAEARRRFGTAEGLSLVLAGVDRGVGDQLCALAAERGVGDAVVRLGRVDEPLLHALYRSATALVYPSMYEGFGLPVLEAMASGTPVIAAGAASIPEVLGDAGLLLDPSDTAGWAETIVRVANTPSLRAELRAAGLARAAMFTWERTARATLDVYRQVVGR